MRPQARDSAAAGSFKHLAATVAAFAISFSPAALAQEQTTVAKRPDLMDRTLEQPRELKLADDRQWTIQFEPSVWLAAPAGRFQVGKSRSTNEVFVSDLNLDSARASPYFELHLRRDRWRIGISGYYLSESDRSADIREPAQLGSLTLLDGDRIKSSLDLWSVEAVVAYRFYDEAWTEPNASPGEIPVASLALGIDALAGARVYSVDLQIDRQAGVSGAAASLSREDFWAEPLVGIKVDAEIYKQFTIDFQTTFGAQPFTDHYSYSWDIQVDGTWRPWPNFGVQIGYRQLLYQLNDGSEDEKFLFRGGLAGLFAGIELRF